MTFHRRIGCTALLLGMAAGGVSVAQQSTEAPADADRPRIGLALSGGGARGGAHIGVLQALRELRVPIDYIAGTSMGAVVGGFYASGLDEDEVERIAREVDWNALFSEDPPRDDRSFRRKRDDDLFLVKQRAGFNDREVQLPLGLIQGQNIDLFLDRTLLPVTHIDDFDALPVPFRAVAAEIATGNTVVLGSGSLSRAIRASLSIPTVFAPIRIDGRLLVDGGISQNMPIETVRAMGADIIIAIDIATPLDDEEALTSLLSITGQLTGLLTSRESARQIETLEADDILITPDLREVGTGDFGEIVDTFAYGYDATMAAADRLRAISLAPGQYAAHRAARPAVRRTALPQIDFIDLSNDSNIGDNIINERLRQIPTGVALDIEATEHAIAEIYGLELFQNVRYSVVEQDGATGLEVSVEERTWGPGYLQGGVEYSSTGDDDTIFGLSLSYLRTAMNELGAEWRSTITLGDESKLSTVWHQPLGFNARAFVAAELAHEALLVNLYDQGVQVARVQPTANRISFSAGREFGNWGEARFGLVRASGHNDLLTGTPPASLEDDFDSGYYFLRFSVDTLDSLYFPTDGTRITAEVRGSREDLGADDDFDQFLGSFVGARSFGKNILTGALRFDTTTADIAPPQDLFRIGGFWDLSGFAENELSGQHVARLSVAYYRRIGNVRLMPTYAGITIETGNAWDRRSDISLHDSIDAASLWLGADTPLGPIYLGYGRAENGRDSIYFFIGGVF